MCVLYHTQTSWTSQSAYTQTAIPGRASTSPNAASPAHTFRKNRKRWGTDMTSWRPRQNQASRRSLLRLGRQSNVVARAASALRSTMSLGHRPAFCSNSICPWYYPVAGTDARSHAVMGSILDRRARTPRATGGKDADGGHGWLQSIARTRSKNDCKPCRKPIAANIAEPSPVVPCGWRLTHSASNAWAGSTSRYANAAIWPVRYIRIGGPVRRNDVRPESESGSYETAKIKSSGLQNPQSRSIEAFSRPAGFISLFPPFRTASGGSPLVGLHFSGTCLPQGRHPPGAGWASKHQSTSRSGRPAFWNHRNFGAGQGGPKPNPK